MALADAGPEPDDPGVLAGSQDPVIRALRVEWRSRARAKSHWARRADLERDHAVPHEEVRARLGLGRHEYARVRRWMEDARAHARASHGTQTFDEALELHEERQVDLVTRFFMLKRQGMTRDEIRQRLGLSHDGYDLTLEWMRDGLAVVRAQRGRP